MMVMMMMMMMMMMLSLVLSLSTNPKFSKEFSSFLNGDPKQFSKNVFVAGKVPKLDA